MAGHVDIVFAAGVLNGSFTLPTMYSRTWNWENIGSVYSLAALFVFHRAVATVFVPKLSQVYRDPPGISDLCSAVKCCAGASNSARNP